MDTLGKLALALSVGGLIYAATKRNAEASTLSTSVVSPDVARQMSTTAPAIVPEANLPQEAINWYDSALTGLGYGGSFAEKLVGFQSYAMQPPAPAEAHYHLTPETQTAIQAAITARGTTAVATSGYGEYLPAGHYRSRY